MTTRDTLRVIAFYCGLALVMLLWFGLFYFITNLFLWVSIVLGIIFGTVSVAYGFMIYVFKDGIF